jgi:hypothetical protein
LCHCRRIFDLAADSFDCVLLTVNRNQCVFDLRYRPIMPDQPATNGTTTPVTAKLSNLALTEYTAAPTPPSEKNQNTALGLSRDWGIPNAFLLPNGYPDVSS